MNFRRQRVDCIAARQELQNAQRREAQLMNWRETLRDCLTEAERMRSLTPRVTPLREVVAHVEKELDWCRGNVLMLLDRMERRERERS